MSELSYLGENWIFMILVFLCISCITVLWGKLVNLPALNKTPLQTCTRCTIYSAPSPVEEGMSGRIHMGCAHSVCYLCNLAASLEARLIDSSSQPPGQYLSKARPPFMEPCSVSFPQCEPGLTQGCSLTKATWASPRGVWSSASSQVNERRPWLVHLIDWLMFFQPGYKSSLTSMSFSVLSTKEMSTSPPCGGSRVLPSWSIYPASSGKKEGP